MINMHIYIYIYIYIYSVCEHEAEHTMFPVKEDFVFVYKAANNRIMSDLFS